MNDEKEPEKSSPSRPNRQTKGKSSQNFDSDYHYPEISNQNKNKGRNDAKDPINIESCLKEFFKTDLLDVQSRYCDRCGKSGEASIR